MEKLMSAVKKAKATAGADREDDYFYYPARDAAGNGSAVLRFLPGTTEDDVPFVKVYSHGFKGPNGKWLIDNCLTTLEQECPVCQENSTLYASMSKDEARKHGLNRRTNYISRVMVVEDKKNPDNEGNVYLFKYGTKIFDKIADALQPVDEDDTQYDVFNLGDGNKWPVFKFKIRKVDGQTNYDKSTFEDGNDALTDVDFKSQFNEKNEINKFVDPSQFKSFEKLKARLDMVLGKSSSPVYESRRDEEDEDEDVIVKEKPHQTKTENTKRVEVSKSDEDEDDIMALVKSITKSEDDDIPF